MEIPLQVSFRNLDPPLGLQDRIEEQVAGLERFFPRIIGCQVMVERTQHRHHQGDLFHLRIRLTVPGTELVVSREPSEHHAHEDIQVAVHDAFAEVRRRLEDHARNVRSDIKTHAVPTHGRIARLFPYEGYGFIQSTEGQEIYFQREAVTDGRFDDLEVGNEVRFFVHAGEGEKGEQASSVTAIGKHHLPPTETS